MCWLGWGEKEQSIVQQVAKEAGKTPAQVWKACGRWCWLGYDEQKHSIVQQVAKESPVQV